MNRPSSFGKTLLDNPPLPGPDTSDMMKRMNREGDDDGLRLQRCGSLINLKEKPKVPLSECLRRSVGCLIRNTLVPKSQALIS